MVRALLDGRKTQTRRALKRHALHKPEPHTITANGADLVCRWKSGIRHDVPSPYAPGDRLWVREAWRTHVAYEDLPPRDMGGEEPIRYEADGYLESWGWPFMDAPGRLRQGMHMPRWASRLMLTVTDVRVQRVQEISEADARAEGVDQAHEPDERRWEHYSPYGVSFRALWDGLNANRGYGWDTNPWICAISFDVHRCNIDEVTL